MSFLIKAVKIAVGSGLAIILANWLGLQYAVAAGIITLLTLQDTKKETLSVACNRMIAFILAVVLSFFAFETLGYQPVVYGIFLLFFTGICLRFRLQDAIPINAVLATHYLLEESMSWKVIGNELFLMIIGTSIGILLNLYIPGNVQLIRNRQKGIEDSLKLVLSQMADEIETEHPQDYDSRLLDQLKEHIDEGLLQARRNSSNTLFQESGYFVGYMEMRNEQYYILREIYEKINGLSMVTSQSHQVASFIRNIVKTLSESQNTRALLQEEERLLKEFKENPLPVTREEFELRAVLYVVLMNFRIFLKRKKRFVDSLTVEQKEKYWKDESSHEIQL